MDILSLPSRIIKKLNYLGLLYSIRCFKDFIIYSVYSKTFDTDNWHQQGGLYCSKRNPYIVNLVNSMDIESVVDVGCGLGSMISKINCNVRLGIDYSENVINAAKKMHKNEDIIFKQGSFDAIDAEFDLIIAANFLHDYSPDEVKIWLTKSIKKNQFKYLILDEIYQNENGYRYKHIFQKLLDNLIIKDSEDFIYEKRRIVLFEVQ